MLSVVIRTKNEEQNIERAIRSLMELAQEIIVVDSGSEDRTVDIAKSLGAKVYFKEWEGYANQLNYGISLCSGDWVLVIDADEEVSDRLRESIKKELQNPKYDVYMLCRRTYYLGAFLNHAWYPEWRVRLFRKGRVRFEGKLHEKAIFEGKAGKLQGDLYHYSFESLYDQYIKTVDYAKKMAYIMKEEGRSFKLYNLLFNPFWHFVKVYFLQLGFMDGIRGLFVASSSFIYAFLKYKFLYELELSEKEGRLW